MKKYLLLLVLAGLSACQSNQPVQEQTFSMRRNNDLFQAAGDGMHQPVHFKKSESTVEEKPYNKKGSLDVEPLQPRNYHLKAYAKKEVKKELQPKSTLPKTKGRIILKGRDVQYLLKSLGYYKGKLDGKIGSKSKQAIKSFQKDHGLKVDGVAGKNTKRKLLEATKLKIQKSYKVAQLR